jgi:ribonuclease HIII
VAQQTTQRTSLRSKRSLPHDIAISPAHMAQQTLVVQMSADKGRRLQRELELAGWQSRAAPYTLFSARGGGATVTLYTSGKLVIQAADPQAFAQQFLGGAIAASAPDGPRHDQIDLVGSDECGKGDYFGPLVVAAVLLPAGEATKLRRGGVDDSKKLGDDTIRKLAGGLRAHYAHAIEVLEPPEYNVAHARQPNVNRLLTTLHAKAIRRIARPGITVLVDQFADASLMRNALADLDIELEQRPRGEQEAAVAAASILARDMFLERMHALSEECAIDLHKGAGRPADDSALRYAELHGFDKLSRVAKLHFKNTSKIAARYERS